jgi:hypothetical protein
MPRRRPSLYRYFVTLPDRAYPFKSRVHGKMVRGIEAYNNELQLALHRYGRGHFGYKLVAYRQAFHFVGSVLFIVFAAIMSKIFFGSDVALYALLIAAIIAISIQEFYLHPRTYGQLLYKGVVDWFAWVLPIGLFLFMSFS